MSCLTIWSTVSGFVTVTRTHSPSATLIDGITDRGGRELSGTLCNLQPLLPLYYLCNVSTLGGVNENRVSTLFMFFKKGLSLFLLYFARLCGRIACAED